MEENVFNEKSVLPDGKSVLKALAGSANFWLELRRFIQDNYGPAVEEWKYYGQKSGWVMKLLSRKRNLFFLTVIKGGFRISFAFGEKAVAAIERSGLPKGIVDEVRNAAKYAEGRGLRVEVRDHNALSHVKALIKIKVEN